MDEKSHRQDLAEWICKHIFDPKFLGTIAESINHGPWSSVTLRKSRLIYNLTEDDPVGDLRWEIEVVLTPSHPYALQNPAYERVNITNPVNWGEVSRDNFLQYVVNFLYRLERKIEYTNLCDEVVIPDPAITPLRVIPDQYGQW